MQGRDQVIGTRVEDDAATDSEFDISLNKTSLLRLEFHVTRQVLAPTPRGSIRACERQHSDRQARGTIISFD